MSSIGYKNGKLCIENTPLEQIASAAGTPIYCYSTAQLADNFHAYQQAMRNIMPDDNFTICYACKANSNQAIIKLLAKLGAGADVVSGGEMYRAFRGGVKAGKMVFSGVGKVETELTKAIKNGILQINVKSVHELGMISKISVREAKETPIAFRINPDVDAKTHAKITTGLRENKFGVDIKNAVELYFKAREMPGIVPRGVAIHIGSQITEIGPFEEAFRRVAELVTELRKNGNTITHVDVGGGLGISYKDETPPDIEKYTALIRDIILPLKVHVILEPGRSITGNAGVLLTRVLNIKEGRDRKFMILDAAMNDLLRPALYGAYHQILPCKEATPNGKKATYDVVGPVCETGDTFQTDAELPLTQNTDLVAIMDAGAYGAAMSSNYNTRPMPGEVLVSDEQFDIIRKTQKIEDIVNLDIVPEWLA